MASLDSYEQQITRGFKTTREKEYFHRVYFLVPAAQSLELELLIWCLGTGEKIKKGDSSSSSWAVHKQQQQQQFEASAASFFLRPTGGIFLLAHCQGGEMFVFFCGIQSVLVYRDQKETDH